MNNDQLGPCDEWTGGKSTRGYGVMRLGSKLNGSVFSMQTHRLVWQQEFGHTDLCILHKCDNPSCINIDHLFAGTPKDNAVDRMQKGRNGDNGKRSNTHCPEGHPYSGENLFWSGTSRKCRKCSQIWASAYYAENKEKRAIQMREWRAKNKLKV